jgi:thiol:disulfide interchange protein
MQRHRAFLCAIAAFGVLTTLSAHARPYWLKGADNNETDFLNPDVAFRVGGQIQGNSVLVRWVMADGYYLYRSKMAFAAESPDLSVLPAELPAGTVKTDPYLGTQQIYTQQVQVRVPIARTDAGAHPVQLKVTYQGCAEAGLCYPPITKVIFPQVYSGELASPVNAPKPWELIAMIAGAAAFLLAGFALRKDRKLASPQ